MFFVCFIYVKIKLYVLQYFHDLHRKIYSSYSSCPAGVTYRTKTYKMSRVCESANLIGPFNIPRSRSGYHPDVNKGEHFPGPEEDNPPIHVKGYTVPSEKAIRGLLLGTYRWETVLLHNDGTCSKYDVLHKEVLLLNLNNIFPFSIIKY